MRLLTLLLGSTVLSGCAGTSVLDVDPSNESDIHMLLEGAEAQSGEIMTAGEVIRFKKGKLQVARDTLWVAPRGRRSAVPTSLPLYGGPLEVHFRYRGSPVGSFIGLVAGAGSGYLIGYSSTDASSCGPISFCITQKGSGLIGAVAGGLLGAILGAFVGPKRTTVYRFRPGTPQQMSVVMGGGVGHQASLKW